jgi:hypothetical protein
VTKLTVTKLTGILLVLSGACLAVAQPSAQKLTDADRAAALVVRWQQIVYPKFEGARAFIGEEQTDALNALLSAGAVRAIHDRLDPAALRKADQAVDRFAGAMLAAGTRRPDGSIVLEAEAFDKALDATCPLYPFCDH